MFFDTYLDGGGDYLTSPLATSGARKPQDCRLFLCFGTGNNMFGSGCGKVCGIIGNGKHLCFKQNCDVLSHKKCKIDSLVGPGLRIEVEEGKVLAHPVIPEDLYNVFHDELEPLIGSYFPKTTLLAVFTTCLGFTDAMMSIEEQKEELSLVVAKAFGKPPGLTPMKPPTASDDDTLIEEELAADALKARKYGARMAAMEDAISDMKFDQKTLKGAMGNDPSAPPLAEWMNAVDSTVADLDQEMENMLRRLKDLRSSVSAHDDKVSDHGRHLSSTEAKLTRQKKLISELITMIGDLQDAPRRSGGVAAGNSGGGVQSLDEVLLRDWANLDKTILGMRAEIDKILAATNEFKLGGGMFELSGIKALKELIRKVPQDCPYLLAIDPIYLMFRLTATVTELEEVQRDEIHEHRVGRNSAYTTLIAANKSMAPPVLVGKGGSKSTGDAKVSTRLQLNAISMFKKFDAKDGVGGIASSIKRALPLTKQTVELELMEGLVGHPDVLQLVKLLLNNSVSFINDFLRFLADQNDILLTTCHGEGPHSQEAIKSVWDLCLLMGVVVFETLWETRSRALLGYQQPATSNLTYLTAALNTHMVMEAFQRRGFSEHETLLPKLVRHMFVNFVSRSNFVALKKESAETKLLAASSKRNYDALQARVALESGGEGGMGLTKNQKRKLKKNAAAARKQAAVEEESEE